MFDFRVVTQWVDATLHQYLPASLVTTTEFVLVGVCLLVAYAVMALGLIYAERKVCAFFQCRLGPNRVGPFGMIQTVTDMIKMLIKELITINHIDRFLFNKIHFRNYNLVRSHYLFNRFRISTQMQLAVNSI